MTEPTYTEAEIREAIDRTNNIGDWTADKIFKELKRPKHDFAEGQVIADTRFIENHVEYDSEVADIEAYRHLNMTELGPHVKALRDGALKLSYRNNDYTFTAAKLVEAFDKAVGEEE